MRTGAGNIGALTAARSRSNRSAPCRHQRGQYTAGTREFGIFWHNPLTLPDVTTESAAAGTEAITLPLIAPLFRRAHATRYFIALLLGIPTLPLRAVEIEPMARQTEAVDEVVLGILSYVRWPHEPAVLNLCVVGPTEYADSLLRGMVQANGRHVHVQRRAASDTQLGSECHAIYLGALSEAERQQVFQMLSGHPVLSISERDSTCSIGSQFCLDIRQQRIAFAVNLDSIARSGVRVHPSVLKLAKRKIAP